MSASYAMYCDINNLSFDRSMSYHEDTDFKVIQALEALRSNRHTCRLFYGNPETGVVTPEEWHCYGRIGCTTGRIKSPLICHPQSHGGLIISSDRILGILEVTGTQQGVRLKRWAYMHPRFNVGSWKLRHWPHGEHGKELPWELLHNGEVYSRHKTSTSAERLQNYMRGNRVAP